MDAQPVSYALVVLALALLLVLGVAWKVIEAWIRRMESRSAELHKLRQDWQEIFGRMDERIKKLEEARDEARDVVAAAIGEMKATLSDINEQVVDIRVALGIAKRRKDGEGPAS